MLEHLFRTPKQIVVTGALSIVLAALFLLILSVRQPLPPTDNPAAGGGAGGASAGSPVPYTSLPTPDPTPMGWQPPSAPASAGQSHTVNAGETLGYIASLYNTTVEAFVQANGLTNPDILDVGQVLAIPGATSTAASLHIGPSFKLAPDSELVYGPTAAGFSVADFVATYDSYLLRYQDVVEGVPLDGAAVVQLTAERLRVHPRLLLAALEFSSGWVTQAAPLDDGYPLGLRQPGYEGLYRQLEWAANQMNRGYYGRAEGGITQFNLADGTTVVFAPDINHGTAGVQLWLGVQPQMTYERWLQETGPEGFMAAYEQLFGNPFGYTYEPIWTGLEIQPALLLPWAEDEAWYFTGGPHGGWAGGSAWAALDFAPPEPAAGCYESQRWLTAVADGIVTRSSHGAVVLDLDGDGFAGTGWAVHYLHVATRDRVAEGSVVKAGDPLGHPSCEGGVSSGTHVHLARTYNGRWVSADGVAPFNLAGWISGGLGSEYDGILQRDGEVKTACACRADSNRVAAGR